MLKTYVFDIDGTICTNTEGQYNKAQPHVDRIRVVNRLFGDGHRITLLTARGMGRFNNDAARSYEEFYEFTKRQLSQWGVKYHDLFLGKPQGDVYVDDKGVSDLDFFTKEVENEAG